MGCGTSRINDSDVVIQCKKRKSLMQEAVNCRQDFAIAHLAYIQALRNVGFALRHFSEGEFSDKRTSPGSPPVLSLPEPSSPPVVALSPPPPVPAISSPPSPPPPHVQAASPSPPLSPSVTSHESPPESPFSEASPPPPVSDFAIHADMSRSISMPPLYSGNGVASPARGSDFSPPYYSPAREDSDDFLGSFPPLHRTPQKPPPPPSPLRASFWLYDIFDPPVIPYHLQEQRRRKQGGEPQEEEVEYFDQMQEEEGMPDLEEEHKEEEPEKEQPEQDGEGPRAEEKTSNIVEENTEEKPAESAENENRTEKVSDKADEKDEKPAVVTSVGKEMDVVSDQKENRTKELAVLTTVIGKDLTEIVRHIDDHFARAYDSGKDVSTMLETQMVHHHLSILDLKDTAKVFNAITWHWSRKTSLAMRDAYDDSDVPECGMAGSHASTLERLYAWEKKLYDEVKAGELIRIAFDRKCKQLTYLDARGEDPHLIDKTRAAIKKLDTRLMVALRAVHSASMRIQQLTNEELYPQLAELLGGLMNMWKVMLECHRTQKAIALDMQTLGKSIAGEETSEAHMKATIELEHELEKWLSNFYQWITSQRKYIDVLFSWLTLCHMIPETDAKERAVSPYWTRGGTPIYPLIKKWQASLVRLEERQKDVDVISDFAAVIHSLEMGQLDDLNLKKQAERSEKGLRKTLSIQNNLSDTRSIVKMNFRDKSTNVDDLRDVMEGEKHKLSWALQDRGNVLLSSLKDNLPVVFDSMASFATVALHEYENLQQEMEHCRPSLKWNGEVPRILQE